MLFKTMGRKPDGGTAYMLGMTNVEMDQGEVLFDFGYAGAPDLFGLIKLAVESKPASARAFIEEAAQNYADRGVTVNNLRLFAFGPETTQKFRDVPFWRVECNVEISHPKDSQIVFAAPTDEAIRLHLLRGSLICPETTLYNPVEAQNAG